MVGEQIRNRSRQYRPGYNRIVYYFHDAISACVNLFDTLANDKGL